MFDKESTTRALLDNGIKNEWDDALALYRLLFASMLFQHQLVKLRGGTQRGKLLVLH
jgi:hypothetical protein